MSTLYGKARAHLAGKNYANHVFPVSLNVLLFFVLFRKTVVRNHKTVDNKAPDQILPYSDYTLFRNKTANSGHSRAAQPNRSENPFVEKTNQYHSFCFGILHGTNSMFPMSFFTLNKQWLKFAIRVNNFLKGMIKHILCVL